ncbi:hypothetical protein ONZ45_g14507 [Pleurotus djamor]|nr:hypothetical protein ONZ45_g14507 [Pleurotus djamor]
MDSARVSTFCDELRLHEADDEESCLRFITDALARLKITQQDLEGIVASCDEIESACSLSSLPSCGSDINLNSSRDEDEKQPINHPSNVPQTKHSGNKTSVPTLDRSDHDALSIINPIPKVLPRRPPRYRRSQYRDVDLRRVALERAHAASCRMNPQSFTEVRVPFNNNNTNNNNNNNNKELVELPPRPSTPSPYDSIDGPERVDRLKEIFRESLLVAAMPVVDNTLPQESWIETHLPTSRHGPPAKFAQPSPTQTISSHPVTSKLPFHQVIHLIHGPAHHLVH